MHLVKTLFLTIACSLIAANGTIEAQVKSKGATTKTSRSAKVDINRASADELMQALDGVGEKRAKAIVKHRRKNSFKTTDDLLQVPGIGPAIILNNFDKLGLPRGKRPLKAGKGKAKNAKSKRGTGKPAAAKPSKKPSKKPSTKKPTAGTTKKPSTKKPTKGEKSKQPAAKKPTKGKKSKRPAAKKPAKGKKKPAAKKKGSSK